MVHLVDEGLELCVALVEVVVGDNLVPHGVFYELHLMTGSLKSDLHLLLGLFRGAKTKALLQFFHARWANEDHVCIETNFSHTLTTLNIQIEEANLAPGDDHGDCIVCCSIAIGVYLRRLNKLSLIHKLLEMLRRYKVIRNTILFTISGGARRVRHRVANFGWEFLLQ